MAGCALLVESSPGTGTTHPPHPALLRPSPCNPTLIRRQVLRLLYGSGTGSLSCLSFARAYFVVPLYQYMRKRETHHYLFVASFNAQTTLPRVSNFRIFVTAAGKGGKNLAGVKRGHCEIETSKRIKNYTVKYRSSSASFFFASIDPRRGQLQSGLL